jgi:hypothetical protein
LSNELKWQIRQVAAVSRKAEAEIPAVGAPARKRRARRLSGASLEWNAAVFV